MFTHLHQHEYFVEEEARFYIGEVILALERLHDVRINTVISIVYNKYVYDKRNRLLIFCAKRRNTK